MLAPLHSIDEVSQQHIGSRAVVLPARSLSYLGKWGLAKTLHCKGDKCVLPG